VKIVGVLILGGGRGGRDDGGERHGWRGMLLDERAGVARIRRSFLMYDERGEGMSANCWS
jgi:hypothetical protein